jgi:hypothetical protein
MKIDDFESQHGKEFSGWKFQDFLDLLRRKFEERQPQRLDRLSKISLYNTEFSQMSQLSKSLLNSINKSRDVLRYHLFEKWLLEVNPLRDLNDGLCTDPVKFREFFLAVVADWKRWCGSYKYQTQTNWEILHNIVMTELPLERFLANNPHFIAEDERICRGLRERRDELLKANTFEFTSTFQENPKLLDPASKQLQQAFDAPLPLVKLSCFSNALNTLVFVLTFEGHKEVGADQWLPMTILLVLLAVPQRLASTMGYIEHFVKSMGEGSSSEVRLIGEQTEYTFTMIKSAVLHFERTLEALDKRD